MKVRIYLVTFQNKRTMLWQNVLCSFHSVQILVKQTIMTYSYCSLKISEDGQYIECQVLNIYICIFIYLSIFHLTQILEFDKTGNERRKVKENFMNALQTQKSRTVMVFIFLWDIWNSEIDLTKQIIFSWMITSTLRVYRFVSIQWIIKCFIRLIIVNQIKCT